MSVPSILEHFPADGTSRAKDMNSTDVPDAGPVAESMHALDDTAEVAPTILPRGWRFWAILASLSIAGLCTTIEGTIITNALPTITAALGGGHSYIWVPNAYFLASVATLPLYAQMSNIFGRRWLLLSAMALFVLGSGLCGGSTSMGMLIASRTVQGLGGGGISLLIETVVTDLVPLRERGKYMAIVLMASIIGAAVGPFIGGVIVTTTTWRWVFYINVPIGGTALACLFFFMRLNYQKNQTWMQRLKRVDYGGNAIVIAAVTSVLIALTWGGTLYTWGSYHIIVPLVLGLLGLLLFLAFEWNPKLAPEPSVPRLIVSNRTSSAALVMTMMHSIVTYWGFYFLPIYFQSVKVQTPLLSGIDTIPTFAGIVPFALVGGVLLSKTGRYKPMHIAAWCLVIISFGLFSIMDQYTNPAAWVWFQLIQSAGTGLLAGIMLPAVQAALDESLVATSTGLWSFVRGFGAIWGVTIPSAVFNNQCKKNSVLISDPAVAARLSSGAAYELATKAFVDSIGDDMTRQQVINTFTRSMRTVWYVGIAFCVIGFLSAFLEKEIKLREELATEFGIKDEKKKNAPEELALGSVAAHEAGPNM